METTIIRSWIQQIRRGENARVAARWQHRERGGGKRPQLTRNKQRFFLN
jgi:hypothetical protein